MCPINNNWRVLHTSSIFSMVLNLLLTSSLEISSSFTLIIEMFNVFLIALSWSTSIAFRFTLLPLQFYLSHKTKLSGIDLHKLILGLQRHVMSFLHKFKAPITWVSLMIIHFASAVSSNRKDMHDPRHLNIFVK